MALSIDEFCESVGITEDFFYTLKRQGQAPRMMKVSSRTMVTLQAAHDWLTAREADAAAKIEA